MLDARLLPALADLTQHTAEPRDPHLDNPTNVAVVAAISHLVCVQQALPSRDLSTVTHVMEQLAGVTGCDQFLAATMWGLCRHEANRWAVGGWVAGLCRLVDAWGEMGPGYMSGRPSTLRLPPRTALPCIPSLPSLVPLPFQLCLISLTLPAPQDWPAALTPLA